MTTQKIKAAAVALMCVLGALILLAGVAVLFSFIIVSEPLPGATHTQWLSIRVLSGITFLGAWGGFCKLHDLFAFIYKGMIS